MNKTSNSLFHKILVTILTLSLIFSNIGITGISHYAYAEDEEGANEPWDGSITPSEEMEMDSDGYYLIDSAADLAGFASIVNDEGDTTANAKLTADIDLANLEWTPIANEDLGDCYYGTFDGQGHIISNLKVSKGAGWEYAGLFAWASGAVISGVTVTGSVYGSNFAGGIVGSAEFDTITITQCRNEASVSSKAYAGGLLGYGAATITECANSGTIKSNYSAGGFAGGSYATEISSSYNSGQIEGGDFAGGIVGYDEGFDLQFKSVYSSASISYDSSNKFDGVKLTGEISADNKAEIVVSENESDVENVFGYDGDLWEWYFLSGYQALIDWCDDDGNEQTMQALTDALNDGGKLFTCKEGAWPVLTWEAQAAAVSPEEIEAAVKEAEKAIEAALAEESAYDVLCGAKAEEIASQAKTDLAKASSIRDIEKIKKDAVSTLTDIPTAAYKTAKKAMLDGYLKGDYNESEWEVIESCRNDLNKIVDASISIAEIDAKTAESVIRADDVIAKDAKADALVDLDEAYAKYNQEDYSEANWEKLTQTYTQAKSDIESSHSKEAILGVKGSWTKLGILANAKSAMSKINNKIAELRTIKTTQFTEYFKQNYDKSNYSSNKWESITNSRNNGYYDRALSKINSAASEEEMDQIIEDAKSKMAEVYTLAKEEELKAYKARLKAELDSRFNAVDKSQYEESDYDYIKRSINSQKSNIDNSYTFEYAEERYQYGIKAIQQTVTIAQRAEQNARIDEAYDKCLQKKSEYSDEEWAKVEKAYGNKYILNVFAEFQPIKEEADRIIRNMTNAMTREELENFEASRNDILALLKAEYEKYTEIKSDYDQNCDSNEEGWAKLESIYNKAVSSINNVKKDEGKATMTQFYEQAALDMSQVVSVKAKSEDCIEEITVIGQGYVTSGLYNEKGEAELNAIVINTITAIKNATSVKSIEALYESGLDQLANVMETSGESKLKSAIEDATEAFTEYFYMNYPDSNEDRYEEEDWDKLHEILADTIKKIEAVYTKSYDNDLKDIENEAKNQLGKISLKNAKLAALVSESVEQLGKKYNSNLALLDYAKDNMLEAFSSFAYDLFEKAGEDAIYVGIDMAKSKLSSLYNSAKAVLEALDSSKDIKAKTSELLNDMDSETQKALTLENSVPYEDKWDGITMTKPETGDGTKQAPYLISNAAELAWFANEVNSNNGSKAGINGKLCSDIDLAGYQWTAIGEGTLNSPGFRGCFDGQGHTIHNLYIDTEGMNGTVYSGLFGIAEEGSEIRNLNVAGEISFDRYAETNLSNSAFGGIAGYVKTGLVYNCISSVKITRNPYTAASQIGGIAGLMNGGTIERCDSRAVFVDADMREYRIVGGIVGSIGSSGSNFAMVRYCTYNGQMKVAGSYMGGIAGYMRSGSIVRECINNAPIGCGEGAAGSAYMGGITAYATGYAKIMHVYNHGNVEGDVTTSGIYDATGGIIGCLGQKNFGITDFDSNPVISYAYNDGLAESKARVGGLAGKIVCGTVEESQSCSDNRMFGYVENSGTKVDNSVLTDSIEFISTGAGDDAATALLKFDATQELKSMYKLLSDRVYGSQSHKYNSQIDKYIRKIEEAGNADEINKALAEGKAELAKVKTQLDTDKEDAISQLKLYVAERVYDSKKAEGQEKSIAEQVSELLNTAIAQVESANTVKDVKDLLEKYLGTEEAAGEFAYFETYNAQTIKGLYSDFLYNKAYTAEDRSKVQAAYERWAAAIENADSEKKINELEAEAKKELTELTKNMEIREEGENSTLPEFTPADDDTIKAEKEQVYKNLVSQYDWKDYSDSNWETISGIFAALKASLTEAENTEDVNAAINSAKASLEAVLTLEQEALNIAADDAETALKDKIGDFIAKLKKFFTDEKEKIGEEKLNESNLKEAIENAEDDGITAIENAGKDEKGDEISFKNLDMTQIREMLDNAIESAETAFEAAVQKLKSLFSKVGNVDENSWDGVTLSQPLNGNGTLEEPYKIESAAQLAWFAALVNGQLDGEYADGNADAHAVLTADINLAYKDWTPIGHDSCKFTGSLDGADHKIEGLYISNNNKSKDADSAGRYGLFGFVGSDGKISNLTTEGIIDVNVGKEDSVGGIAAYVSGGKVENCISETEINVDLGSVKDTKGYAGIVGEGGTVTIIDCINKGNISVSCSTSNYARGISGILGYSDGYDTTSCRIERCVNSGDIKAYKAVGTGGIMGYAISTKVSINECLNEGDITVEIITDTYGKGGTGGIVGAAVLFNNEGNITNVYNVGKIKAESLAGGIIGGERTGYQYNSSTSGGLTENISNGEKNLKLAYTYNAGIVEGPSAQVSNKVASIVGLPIEGSYMTNLFMVEGTAKSAMGYISTKGNKITTITSDELKKSVAKTIFAEDSSAIESIADINNGYPIFSWQLLDKEKREAVKKYLNDYYEVNVKPIASQSQCEQIEKLLGEKQLEISGANNAESIIAAYESALEAMDVNKLLEQARTDARTKLESIDITGYPKKLQSEITELIKSHIQKIETAENAREIDDIVDAVYAGITDVLISDIENPKFVPDTATEEEAEEYQEKIDLAKREYANLTDAQKKLVTGYIKIAKAEEKYAQYAKRMEEIAMVDSVINKIESIGKVTLESYNKIMDAMNSYNALTQNQASMVPTLTVDKLKAAVVKYNALLSAAQTGTVVIDVTPVMHNKTTAAKVDFTVLSDAVDTALQIGVNSIRIRVADSGSETDEILLTLSLDALQNLTSQTKTSVIIESVFGELKLTASDLKKMIDESDSDIKTIKISKNDEPQHDSQDQPQGTKPSKKPSKKPSITPSTKPSGMKYEQYAQYEPITDTLKYTDDANNAANAVDDADNVNNANEDEIEEVVQITDDNLLSEPKKSENPETPFDWSIVLMLAGIVAACGIGGGIFKWMAVSKNHRRK